MPNANISNKKVIDYLHNRNIPLNLLHVSIEKGLLYQDIHDNCVFVCKDKAGIVKGGILRGTKEIPFKGRVRGSNINYGWTWNIQRKSEGLVVVESPVDLLSLLVLYPKVDRFNLISMGGLHIQAVKTFLGDNSISNIYLLFDNDQAGRSNAEVFKREFQDNFEVKAVFPKHGKDWNEQLQNS